MQWGPEADAKVRPHIVFLQSRYGALTFVAAVHARVEDP